MYDHLLALIGFVWILQAGVCDEKCVPAIVARRQVLYVPAGGALSLSCVVRHCGDTWTDIWIWKNSTDETFKTLKDSPKHHLTQVIVSHNETQLVLKMQSVNQSDEGSYACKVTLRDGFIILGHLTYLNITTDVPQQRDFVHRIIICSAALLCLPIILGLARCLSSNSQPFPKTEFTYAAVVKEPPKPPPRRPIPQKRSFPNSHKAPPKIQQKTEVVYADISKDSLMQQGATRGPHQSTVYSSVKFP